VEKCVKLPNCGIIKSIVIHVGDFMDRVNFIEYKNVKILDLDFSGASKKEVIGLLSEASELIINEEENSVFVLTNVKDVLFDKYAAEHFEYISNKDRNFVVKSAMYEVNENQKLLIEGIGSLTGRRFMVFDSRDEALKWLMEDLTCYKLPNII